MNRLKKRLFFFFLGFFLLFLIALGINFFLFPSQRTKKVVIGGKNCTEGNLLSEMLAILLEEWTDLKVIRKFQLDSSICFSALLSGDIDVYVEYTGTALYQILKEKTFLSAKEGYKKVKQEFAEKFNLVWLKPLGFENHFVLVMREENFDQKNIRTLSDLATTVLLNKKFAIGFDQEFIAREEFSLLKQSYHFRPPAKYSLMDHAFLYLSLVNGSLDVINGYSTDGLIEKYNLKTLVDDKKVFSSYVAAPLVRKNVLRLYPNLEEILNLLSDKITENQMQKLNLAVEIQGEIIHQVAHDFLLSQHLIP